MIEEDIKQQLEKVYDDNPNNIGYLSDVPADIDSLQEFLDQKGWQPFDPDWITEPRCWYNNVITNDDGGYVAYMRVVSPHDLFNEVWGITVDFLSSLDKPKVYIEHLKDLSQVKPIVIETGRLGTFLHNQPYPWQDYTVVVDN